MTRDEFFQELYKRPPTEEEIARFSRFGDVLNLAKEDSMWYIILVNEFYDNRHVERLQDVERVAKGAAQFALKEISEAVREKADEIAAIKSRGFLWRSWGFMMSVLVLLCAACLNAGYVMGSGRYPFWLSLPQSGFSGIVSWFLNVPSGWIFLLCSSPFLLGNVMDLMATMKRNARLGITDGKGQLRLQVALFLMSFLLILCLVLFTF